MTIDFGMDEFRFAIPCLKMFADKAIFGHGHMIDLHTLADLHFVVFFISPSRGVSFAGYKDRKAVATALKTVYTAVDAEAAEAALSEFEASDLAARYPAIAPSWRRAWSEVIPFLDYPPEVRRLIYTTNAIEALNSKIRRAVRTRGHFPSDDAAAKLIYLALNATSQEWKRSVREWHAVKSQFAIMFENRFPMA